MFDRLLCSCIFLELFTRRPVFQGQDEIHQLDVIFKVMGTPDVKTWPDVAELPWYELVKPKQALPSQFRETFGGKLLETAGSIELAESLLAMNPARRVSAEEALELAYFTTEAPEAERPTMCVLTFLFLLLFQAAPVDFGRYRLADLKGDWHELTSKKATREARKRKEAASGGGGGGPSG
jgi:CTD kinase subunit alpha